MARNVAGVLSQAETGQVKLAVTGDYGPKTERVILDALKLNESKRLIGLELLLIGSPEIRSGLQTATENLGGRFYFRPAP
jgi:hypothetical protein